MQKYSYSVSEVYSSYELNNKFNLIAIANNNESELETILTTFKINPSILSKPGTQVTIRLDEDNLFLTLPLVISKYYDENDHLFSKIKLNGKDAKIESFSGEIYEKLNFDTTSLDEFLQKNKYQTYIYPETKSCIHFQGIEWNLNQLRDYYHMEQMASENDHLNEKTRSILAAQKERCKEIKELYITKTDKIYTMYYNAPYIYDNLNSSNSFACEEIDSIIDRINDLLKLVEQSEDKDRFLLYVIASLRQYQKTIVNKGYRQEQLIDSKTLSIIEKSIIGNKKEKNNVYFKLKIVSDEPIELIHKKDKMLLKK